MIFLFCVALFSACAPRTYYQVYQVESVDIPVVDNHYVYENDNLLVRYDFCRRGGDVSFYCYNKSDETLYIHLDRSFYISNGIAYDYYKDNDYTVAVGSVTGSSSSTSFTKSEMINAGASLSGTVVAAYGNTYDATVSATVGVGGTRTNEYGIHNASSVSRSVTTHSPKVIAIPSHTAKYINGFTIIDSAMLLCGPEMYRQNFPRRMSELFKYNATNTLVAFSNLISYSFQREGAEMQSFKNSFYVSSMQNMDEDQVLIENRNYRPGGRFSRSPDACSTNEYDFTITDPKAFYNVFK